MATLHRPVGRRAVLHQQSSLPYLSLIAGGLLAFSITQSRRWEVGVSFALGVGLAFALLLLTDATDETLAEAGSSGAKLRSSVPFAAKRRSGRWP